MFQDVDLVTFSYLSFLLADKYNSLIRTAAAGPRSVALRTNERTRSPVRRYEHANTNTTVYLHIYYTKLVQLMYLGANGVY